MAIIRYVSDVDPNGWLLVRLDSGGTKSLPYYLKVNYIETYDKRDYFEILEGENINNKASVSLKSNCTSYLVRNLTHRQSASLIFEQNNNKLIITGLGNFNAISSSSNAIPKGTYDIQIPAAPHSLGSSYTSDSKYAETWFRIGSSGSRFLHVGRISAGCLTVTERSKWTSMYLHLIKSRKNSRNVGTLIVR